VLDGRFLPLSFTSERYYLLTLKILFNPIIKFCLNLMLAYCLFSGMPQKCKEENKAIEVPGITDDPCITCLCQVRKIFKCGIIKCIKNLFQLSKTAYKTKLSSKFCNKLNLSVGQKQSTGGEHTLKKGAKVQKQPTCCQRLPAPFSPKLFCDG